MNWTGTRAHRKRLTLYQIRSGFGRPIKAASLEPMPQDGLAEADLARHPKANMPGDGANCGWVFDEPPVEGDAPPTSVFLIGRETAPTASPSWSRPAAQGQVDGKGGRQGAAGSGEAGK